MTPQPSVVIAPWTLARVAGLPTSACDLVGNDTAESLEELAEREAALRSASESVVDACFALVPTLDDAPELRRLALAIKRAAHKGADLPGDSDHLPALLAQLPERSRAAVEDYSAHATECARLRRDLTKTVADDGIHGDAVLLRQLDHAPFVESLAIAAPEWIAHGLKKAQHQRLDARGRRTLYSYVTRTALKTSPFSRLTTVAIPGGTAGDRRSYAGATVAYAALHAVARDTTLAYALRYRTAYQIGTQQDEPTGFVLHGNAMANQTLAWLSIGFAHGGRGPEWLNRAENAREYNLDELFALIGGSDPWPRYLRLLDSGWVEPIPTWSAGTEPLGVVAALVEHAKDSHPLAEEIHRVHTAANAVASATTPDRARAVGTIAQGLTSWRTASRLRLWSPDLAYEDAATEFDVPELLTAETKAAVDVVARELRPLMFRSHLYDFLLEAFVSRFGSGGRCDDVLAFLAGLTVEDRAELPMAQALYRDRAPDSARGRTHLPVGITSAPPTVSLFVQPVADHIDDLASDRFTLVLNQLGSGLGGLLSRFSPVLGNTLSTALTTWLAELWPGMPCYELIPSRSCTTAQHTSAGTLPSLVMPGEVASNGLAIEHASLVHDATHNVLNLHGPDGAPFGLAYLGLVPAHLSSGAQRLLLTLADPWVLPYQFGDYSPAQPSPTAAGDIIASPRRSIGRVVVQRAGWTVPVDQLPLPHKGESEVDLVLRADRWRRAHGIPAEVFCRQADAALGSKPMWADLRSAISLTVLGQALPGKGRIRLAEVLPQREQHPLRAPFGGRLASEHVVSLRWQREQKP